MDAGAFGRAIRVLDEAALVSGSAAPVLRESLDLLAGGGDDLMRIEAQLSASRSVLADAIGAGVGGGSSVLDDAHRTAGNVIASIRGVTAPPTHEAILLGTPRPTFSAAHALRYLRG